MATVNNLTQEDIDFLKDLQRELRTQDSDGTAQPVFWGIMDSREVKSNYGEVRYYDIDSSQMLLIEEVVDVINDMFNSDDLDKDLLPQWRESQETEWGIEEFASEYADMNLERIHVKEESFLTQYTGAFITKRAAKHYLNRYAHHHRKPHTFAMWGEGNEELAKLLDILTKMEIR